MITDSAAIRNRLEQARLSYEGYTRQLARLDLTPERQDRLRNEVALLQQEIATLEKVAQWLRVEEDRGRIERGVRERLEAVRTRAAADHAWAGLSQEERDAGSGEVRALLWLLGEDRLSRLTSEMARAGEERDPTQAERAARSMLLGALRNGTSDDVRAGAAHELGAMRVAEAIPLLVEATSGPPLLAETARAALRRFSEAELRATGLNDAQLAALLAEM